MTQDDKGHTDTPPASVRVPTTSGSGPLIGAHKASLRCVCICAVRASHGHTEFCRDRRTDRHTEAKRERDGERDTENETKTVFFKLGYAGVHLCLVYLVYLVHGIGAIKALVGSADTYTGCVLHRGAVHWLGSCERLAWGFVVRLTALLLFPRHATHSPSIPPRLHACR